MTTSETVLQAGSLRTHPVGASILVGLPWYRSLPWAGIAAVRVAIDGRPCDVVSVDGASPDRLRDREDYWFLQHRAEVIVDTDLDVASGTHVVWVQLELLIPGPLKPDGSPMHFGFELDRELTAPGR